MSSIELHDIEPTQAHKRNSVRTIFTAIEGLSWLYREDIRSTANTIDPLSPLMELAFTETSYFVNEKGHVQEQTRFISMPAMIRLASRVAEQICPKLKIDFGVTGWTDLQLAIKVRNRVTHPKSISDLQVSDGDIEISKSALLWFLELTNDVMEATLSASTQYLSELRFITEKMKAGDEKILEQYRAVLMESRV
jgi:FlaG/FlaF family flagellin (archaellin)